MRVLKIMTVPVLATAFALSMPGTPAAHGYYARAKVMTFDGAMVGRALLKRDSSGISVDLRSRGLEPGHSYSLWWVIFNNPKACAGGPGGCLGSDLANPDVEGTMMNAAGRIADQYGRMRVRAFLPVGFMHSGEERQVRGPGLQNLHGAEVHAVLRTHGEAAADPLDVVSQLSTLNGVCNTPCANVQFAVFPPRK